MKDFLKKSNIFFLVAPIAACIWAVLASTVFLDNANDQWKEQLKDFEDSQPIIKNILALDPDRIGNLNKQKKNTGKFDYNIVIEKFADAHGIPETGYSLRATGRTKRRGVLTQSATLTIDNIKLLPFSKFLTEMLYVWPNLECEKLSLTKLNSGPNDWKAQMQYKYTFKKKG